MEGSDYSPTSRLLHHIALGVPFITRASFELEQLLNHTDSSNSTREKHVFIAGLARAGTTLLLRQINDTHAFRSLNYRDMPFPLMPSLWRKLSNPFIQSISKRERAHGDKLMVDSDSPEAFEEVFWRIFTGKQYIHHDRLTPSDIDEDTIEQFRNYIFSLLAHTSSHGESRYLSKNNNNILRLPVIRKSFPEAIIIIPFRDPLLHAASLHRQHLRFSQTYAQDSFAQSYMNWLGHFEFGLNHRPFIFSQLMFDKLSKLDPNLPDYWLTLWTDVYRFLLDAGKQVNAVFISYERFCTQHEDTWKKLCTTLEINTETRFTDEIRPVVTTPSEMMNLPQTHRDEASSVYEALRAEETLFFN